MKTKTILPSLVLMAFSAMAQTPLHHITDEKAAGYISAFLNEQTLGNIGLNVAIGGLMGPPDDIKLMSVEGKLFWYCWNVDDIPGLPKFFLSYETTQFNSSPEVAISHNELHRPDAKYVFRYPDPAKITKADVLTYLHKPFKQWTGSDKDPDVVIIKSVVQTLSDNFKNNFPTSGKKNDYNTYPFGCFNAAEFRNDLGMPEGTKYIRYYFGYDSASPVNKIRLILAGVDENGNNLTGTGYTMFEQSWPPEPQ